MNNAAPFGISVIICTRNGAKRINSTLTALRIQNVPAELHWEIILIDNGSEDNTAKIADDARINLKINIPFRIYQVTEQGKSNALIKGYEEANYELMLVCDDDNWLQPDYLQTVAEIFSEKPKIGLLGGYGIAEFGKDKKPAEFDKWQHIYACGKLFDESGYLGNNGVIWGAGSVIRKTMWLFLRENGFHYLKNPEKGKALEDVELSHAVVYTGCKLYFDERLWFCHDLSGGRINQDNLEEQAKINFRNNTAFFVFLMAFRNSPDNKNSYNISFLSMLFSLSINLMVQLIKKDNRYLQMYISIQLKEFLTHRKKYKLVYNDISPWISKVKNSYPLNEKPNE